MPSILTAEVVRDGVRGEEKKEQSLAQVLAKKSLYLTDSVTR
jgi:hypothetical protein